MKTTHSPIPRKRAVNLSISEDVVRSARAVTGNLSRVVEDLLIDFVANEQARAETRRAECRATADLWNAFGEAHGSFADEHSTL